MTDYRTVARQLTDSLGLRRRPVAVAFRQTPPAGMAKFAGTEPSGSVPARQLTRGGT